MAPTRESILKEGILAGLIGAAVVAVWFLAFDLWRGQPFLTPGLLRAHRALSRTLIGSWGNVVREGIVAGLLAAAVVAVWFLAIDAIQGEPLRTPKLLGTALLRQADPFTAIVSYTIAHGIAFALFGIAGAMLIAGAERQPLFVFALVIFFTAFEVFFIGGVLIAARWVLDELAGWTVFVGNLLATAVILGYFIKGHHALARRLTAAWAEED